MKIEKYILIFLIILNIFNYANEHLAPKHGVILSRFDITHKLYNNQKLKKLLQRVLKIHIKLQKTEGGFLVYENGKTGSFFQGPKGGAKVARPPQPDLGKYILGVHNHPISGPMISSEDVYGHILFLQSTPIMTEAPFEWIIFGNEEFGFFGIEYDILTLIIKSGILKDIDQIKKLDDVSTYIRPYMNFKKLFNENIIKIFSFIDQNNQILSKPKELERSQNYKLHRLSNQNGQRLIENYVAKSNHELTIERLNKRILKYPDSQTIKEKLKQAKTQAEKNVSGKTILKEDQNYFHTQTLSNHSNSICA